MPPAPGTETLYARVARNRVKLAVFVASFVAVLMVGAAFSGLVLGVLLVVAALVVWGAVFPGAEIGTSLGEALVIAFALASSTGAAYACALVGRAVFGTPKRLLRRLGATLAPTGEYLGTKHALKAVSLAAGYERSPQLYVIDVGGVNAFALGNRRARTVIGVTRGFAEKLGGGDQRAVFANLLARTISGDIVTATVVTELIAPVWQLREAQMRRDADVLFESEVATRTRWSEEGFGWRLDVLPLWLVAGMMWVIVSEILAVTHQRQARFAAEAADAEGMLLLKDPREMLRGLERVLMADNYVKTAGEAYSSLFYCWAGLGFAPEDDPEMRRLTRLRSVLGSMAAAEDGFFIDEDVDEYLAPPAPRLVERG